MRATGGADVIGDVISLMQSLYFDEGSARAVLIKIGFPPPRIPLFRAADTFWPDVVIRLEGGIIVDGICKLLNAARADNPGSETVSSLLQRFGCAPANGAPTARRQGPFRVLCLFADPVPRSRIRLDREKRLLDEIAEHGGIEVAMRHAVRVSDIIRAIIAEKPQILHFGGHGTADGRLVFEQDDGSPGLVGPGALAAAIAASAPQALDCVVLNSCFTGQDAESFRGATRAVAGSAQEIEDRCALSFTRGFYTGLRSGQAVSQAYQTGAAEMQLQGCDTAGLHFVTFP
jgi:hypothetical protein